MPKYKLPANFTPFNHEGAHLRPNRSIELTAESFERARKSCPALRRARELPAHPKRAELDAAELEEPAIVVSIHEAITVVDHDDFEEFDHE